VKSLSLLKRRQFAAYFWTQFFGAFNDNFFKNALVILITFHAAEKLAVQASILVTLAGGIFILPFFLFSATAGQIAEVSEKARLMQKIKFFEIAIMLLAVYGFLMDQIYFLLLVLFLMGFQSTIFGPVKYSVIPQIVEKQELLSANAIVELGTFLAILLGTLLGGIAIIDKDIGVYLVSAGVLLFAGIGLLSSLLLKPIPALSSGFSIGFNPFTESKKILKHLGQNDYVFYGVIGISWFWLLGASYLSLFPSYTKEYLLGNEYVVNLLLTCFSVGIGLGSLICEKISKGMVGFRFVPMAMLGMSLCGMLLYWFSPDKSSAANLYSLTIFLQNAKYFVILLSLLLFALFGGLYIVPLYSMVQKYSDPKVLSRVIAGNNILNALFMVVASVIIITLLKAQLSIPQIFAILSIGNLVIAYLLIRKLK
tara:strand:- start:18902 stop:20173 length:1272 start_codon:yes stop_codon:yes gene_type:complete